MAEDKLDQEPMQEPIQEPREGQAASGQSAEGAAHESDGEGVAPDTVDIDQDDESDAVDPDIDVVQLLQEVEQARDAALRAQAEAQNVKRRAEQDVEKARKFALERFCSELLPVVDNLERALESAGGDDDILKPIAEGVDLTLKSFMGALKKFQIEAVDPAGEPFDPQLHQAMSMVENPDAEPNTVMAVMQKGYTLNGRLVRPAMVLVSKAPTGS